ncbi:MAG: TraB/GumN family protein [Chromatiaceae bacterium]|nr:TraB/GumN family protein [Chromatiaceae bacterium]MCP5314003.1 TraB/GumN family protein [Chromatiaceae bacterium]
MHDSIAKCVCLRHWLAALVLLALAAVCTAGQGPVFVVTHDAGPPSYLVGTMHTDDPRVLALLERLRPLIDQVDGVAIEVLPDAVTMLAVGAATLLPADQSLRDLIGVHRFAQVEDAVRDLGIPTEVLDRLKPWAVAVTLGMPVAQTGQVLDNEIYLYALQHQRLAFGLESAAEQIAVFDGLSTDAQVELLDQMVGQQAQQAQQIEQLTAAYLSGDLDQIDQVADAQQMQVPEELQTWFDKALLADRNRRMLTRLGDLLDRHSLFIAVGALHLGGDAGLVAGLRDMGYSVERWDR